MLLGEIQQVVYHQMTKLTHVTMQSAFQNYDDDKGCAVSIYNNL